MSKNPAASDWKPLKGLAEAERQLRVGRRLHREAGAEGKWDRLSPEERRPFVDLSCVGANQFDLAADEKPTPWPKPSRKKAKTERVP